MPICKHPLHSWHNRLTNYKKTYDSIEIEFANHRQNSLILSPIALRNLNNFVKISLPTHEPLLQTCAHIPKPPINTSIIASIFLLGTQFSKPHVPKCIKPTFSVILFLSKML